MARLAPPLTFAETDYHKPYEEWPDVIGLRELMEQSDALAEGEVVGALLSWPRGDGAAYYQVTKASPLTLRWIQCGDEWTVEPALIRGLTLADVRQEVWHRRQLRQIFGAGRSDTRRP
jgi:hypothetical protein